MMFSILVILFIGVIAFFHYVQGFFSATISAILTVIAAALALGYHETVVNMLLKGKMAEQAHGMVLCMIFAVVYVVLRLVFDAAIPGNVRTPSTVDKVGAGLMGLVAGIFCTGIFSIAVQSLPWDPTISFMGYARYGVDDKKEAYVPSTHGQQKDSFTYAELKGNAFIPENKLSMWVPTDDWVMDTVYHLSNGGSLAGDRPMASVHPDYLQELFGERLGIQVGAKHTTLALNGDDGAEIGGLFTAATFPCFDGQLKEVRPKEYQPQYKLTAAKPTDPHAAPPPAVGVVKPGPGQQILVVRVKVKSIDGDDADHMFRFSTGSVHLVGRDNEGNYKDYYPIGELENGSAVLLDKPDDFLFTKDDGGFDAVFVIDNKYNFVGSGGKNNETKVGEGVSISIKRFSVLDLTGMTVSTTLTSDPNIKVQRSEAMIDFLKDVMPPAAPASGTAPQAGSSSSGGSTAAAPQATAPETPATAQPVAGKPLGSQIDGFVSNSLRSGVRLSTGTAGDDVKNAPVVGGGTMSLNSGKIEAATVDPIAALTQIGSGENSSNLIYYNDKTSGILQVQLHPYQSGWDFMSQLKTVKVIDVNNNDYAANGFYTTVKNNDSTSLLFRFSTDKNIPDVSMPAGTPDSELYFIFVVPRGLEIKTFSMGGKTQDLSSPQTAP